MRPRKPTAPLDEDALYNYAVKLLGQQMRTVVQLQRLLQRRIEPGEPGEAKMQAVIARLKERRYLDDTSFAQDYARLRQENAGFGKRRVQQDLMRKGVHAAVISQTLEAAYAGVDEEALARRLLERKRTRQPENDKEVARVVRMLVRAGFATGVIFSILKQWDVKDETLHNLDSLDDTES
jgi:regulatory protein